MMIPETKYAYECAGAHAIGANYKFQQKYVPRVPPVRASSKKFLTLHGACNICKKSNNENLINHVERVKHNKLLRVHDVLTFTALKLALHMKKMKIDKQKTAT